MTRAEFFGKLWRANACERKAAMDLSESRRRTLAFWSIGLTFLAMAGSIAAWQFVDGFAIDWPLMGIMVATLASMAAVLIRPIRPRLYLALTGIALTLTFPLATWVLWRIFA
jgi:hypothetical protein